MDRDKDNLRSLNRSSDERKASSFSPLNPSQDDSPRSPLLNAATTSHLKERRQDRKKNDRSLPNNVHPPQQQQAPLQHDKGGRYDHLPLARLLQQYQQQVQQQQQQQEEEEKQQPFEQERQLPPQARFDQQGTTNTEPRELHVQKEQPSQQQQQLHYQQQEQQEAPFSNSNTKTDADFTPTALSLPSPPLLRQMDNEVEADTVAAMLLLGRDSKLTPTPASTTTTTTKSEVAAAVAAPAPKPCDLLAASTNAPVQPAHPFADSTTAAASRTGGTTPYGIAGTALPSLFFKPGQNLPVPRPQFPFQHSPQEYSPAGPASSPSRNSAAAAAAATNTFQSSSLLASPFSLHTVFPTFERNPAMTQRALHQMQQVLDAIPLMHKTEYALAFRMVPHLVWLESDPTRFLRYTKWDPQAAAHKLVAYWKRRVAIFGPNRAYLPLTLRTVSAEEKRTGVGGMNGHGSNNTETSALSKEDVALIREGFIAYAAYPAFGGAAESTVPTKTVVIFDASRQNNDAWDVRLRAFFYHAHCISQNPVSQTEGCVILCIVQSPQYYDHHTMECLSMLLDTFPVRLHEWHTFDCSSMAALSSSSASSALLGQGYLFAYFEIFLNIMNEYTTYHYSVRDPSSLSLSSSSKRSSSSSSSGSTKKFTPDEICWELVTEHGFTTEEIPAILGGRWTYHEFGAWLRERMLYERSRYFHDGSDHANVGTLRDDQTHDKRTGFFVEPMTGVTYDTNGHDDHHRRRNDGGLSLKRSKRDIGPSGFLYGDDSERKDEVGDDAKPRALNGTHIRTHRISIHDQQEDGDDSEDDGSLDDMMNKFQQLLFSDPSTSSVLPKSSQQHLLASRASGQWSATQWGTSQQQQQLTATGTYSRSSTSPVSPFMSRMNHLHPVALLEKALNAIPMHDKVEFMRALRVAPRLVARESDPMRFFVFHEYNAERAAMGLVRYWKSRYELFGDRAYLPMAIFALGSSGDAQGNGDEGALTAEDIIVIRSGYNAIVGVDREGSPVLVHDSLRRKTEASTAARFRSVFYVYQKMSEFHTSQTLGVVAINIIHTHNMDKVSTKSSQMILKTFPIKFKALHSFDCMEKRNKFHRGFVQGLLGIMVRFFSLTKIYFYTSQCQQERERNIEKLEEQHGLSRDLLPYSIGGTWNYERFNEWLIRRTQEDRQLRRLDVHMNNKSHTTHSMPMNAHGTSLPAANSTTWHPSVEVPSRPEPVPQEPRIDDGSASPLSVDMRKITEKLQSLENATKHLTAQETKAFKNALQSAKPQTWEEECNPELFLRVENFDTQKAGERMAKYWQLRSQTFGVKVYDLMTQTGEDALVGKDLRTLATGFLFLLPTDTNGQSVLYVDLSQLSGNISSIDRNRCIFYMMSLLTENEKSQTDGAILLHRVHSPDFAVVDVSFLEALVKALPLKLCRIHLISHDNIPLDSVSSRLRGVGEVYVHSDSCKGTICSELESFGMERAGLPKFVDGVWGYEKFIQWRELRTRIEWKIPAGLSGRECTDIANFPAMKPYKALEDEKERQRRLNLIHFRRRQYRERVEIATMEENRSKLEIEHKKLLEENRELEKKFAMAIAIVNGENEMVAAGS